VFLALAGLPDAAFAAWGWRVPFLLSVVLLVVCFVIRVRISESPEFRYAQRNSTTQRTPIARAVLHHWRPMVLMMLAYASAGVTFYIGTVYSLSYGTTALHLPRSMMLTLILLVNVLTIVAIPLFGAWSDRWDRKKIFIGGILGMAALSPVWFVALDTRSFGWILVGFVILFVPYAANYGTMPTFFAQVFPPSVRYTGMSLGYTFGTVISSAVAPLIASGLFEATGSWIPIALYMVGIGIVSAVAALFLRERHATPAHPATDSPTATTGASS
jgi:MFS family permease